LLHNALKFTERGTIEFGCRLHDHNLLLFYVRDTGIGIDPARQSIIFSRFQQASPDIHHQYGGTGLGLAIVKGILKLWNGEIWVESTKGEGSAFFFTMPYLPQKNKQHPAIL
jgi:signal transduction histidine kinase